MDRMSRSPWVGVVVCALLLTVGCRDATRGGSRLSAGHILRSRPTARGGPVLTVVERQRGWFETRTEDLQETEDRLRNMVGLRVFVDVDEGAGNLPGSASLSAEGTILEPNTVDFRLTPTSSLVSLGTPFHSIDLGSLVNEVEDACGNAVLSRIPQVQSSCALADVDTTNAFIEAVDMTMDTSALALRWEAPRARWNVDEDLAARPSDDPEGQPCNVFFGRCPFGYECEIPPGGGLGDGTCQWDGAPCDSESPCPFGYTCNSGECVWQEVACTEDLDCVDGRDPAGRGVCDVALGICTLRSRITFDSDATMEQPVLVVEVPWSTSVDPDTETTIGVGAVLVESFQSRLRVQPIPCADRACRGRFRAYEGYRAGAGGDLENHGTGLRFQVAGELGAADYEFLPSSHFGAPLCVFSLFTCLVEVELQVRKQLRRVVREQARTLDGLISQSTIPTWMDEDFTEEQALKALEADIRGGATPLSADWYAAVVPLTDLDLLRMSVDYPDGSTSTLLSVTDGAVTGALPQALNTGASISGWVVNAWRLRNLCGATPTTGIGGTCGADTDGDGVPAWMDPTEPGAPTNCGICSECQTTGNPLCNFTPEADGGVRIRVGPVLPSGATLDDHPVLGVMDFPTTPTLALLLDTSHFFANEVRRVFAGPLDALYTAGRYYTDVRWCPAGTSGLAGCPEGFGRTADSAVFHFPEDTDLDGAPDAFDLCADSALPGGMHVDWDADGHGNECDLCPLHAGHNGDRDEDGDGDMCDCDIDGDACNNELPVAPVAVDGEPPGLSGCSDSGPIWDQDPRQSDFGADNDGDALTDHCDPDDDNDGIFDDGSGDGIGTYTPCQDGVTIGCDDNCPHDANADQADQNSNELGDACDPVCPALGDFYCGDEGAGGGDESSPEEAGPGAIIVRECPADGPGCGFLSLECAEYRGWGEYAWPGIAGGCAPGEAMLYFLDERGRRVAELNTAEVTTAGVAAAVYMPDITEDGEPEIVIGAPDLTGEGMVAALASEDLSVMWQVWGSGGFGAALTYGAGQIFVGAPDANETGTVVSLEASSGDETNNVWFGQTEGAAFGASLTYDASSDSLLIGSPFASAGQGLVQVWKNADLALELYGPDEVAVIGSGPIRPFTFRQMITWDGTRDAIAIGSPAAYDGRGLVAVYGWDGELIAMEVGPQDDQSHLGASLSQAVDFDGDGLSEMFVGAPRYGEDQGAVYILRHDLTLDVPFVIGGGGEGAGYCVDAADDAYGGASLFVGVRTLSHPDSAFGGVWARYAGTVGIP